VSYTEESRLPGVALGSHITVSVNLQIHDPAFKATLIKKNYVAIKFTIQKHFMFEKFPSPRIFG